MPFTFISNFIDDGGEYTVPAGSMFFYSHDVSAPPPGFTFYTSGEDKYVACGSSFGQTGGNSNHRHEVTVSSVGDAGAHTHSASGTSTGASASRDLYSIGDNTIVLAEAGHWHSINENDRSSESGNHNHSFASTYTSYYGNYPKSKFLRVIKATSETVLPPGAILMYNSSTLPPGGKFVFCDGTGGTPDTRGLLVINGFLYDYGGSHNHNHSFAGLSSGGAHSHTYSNNTTSAYIGTYEYRPFSGGGFDGSHAHKLNFTLDSNGAHTHEALQTNNVNYPLIVPSLDIYFIKFIG